MPGETATASVKKRCANRRSSPKAINDTAQGGKAKRKAAVIDTLVTGTKKSGEQAGKIEKKGKAKRGVAENGVTETGTIKAGALQNNMPESGAAPPNTLKPDTLTDDTAKPDTAKPDTTKAVPAERCAIHSVADTKKTGGKAPQAPAAARHSGSVLLSLGQPNARQKLFFEATTRFVAYGGARGGGKSWAVRKKAMLLALRYPGIRILLLRRSYTELRDNHILPLQAELRTLATYRETDKAFTFYNGSRLKFGYCDSERDVLQYQGQEFDVMFLDEATQFSEFQYHTLTACLRGANANPKRMYLTCNPGGVGHAWVKRLFIDCDYRAGEQAQDYLFIPARVYDNRALLTQDAGYVRMLENLPPALRRAWLEGDWNVFAGQYFSEWRQEIHVMRPFGIPAGWRRYFCMDYGLDMLAGYWVALAPDGKAYVYREIYESGLIGSRAAQSIRSREDGEKIFAYLAPPDLWNRRNDTGKRIAEIFAENGLYLTQAKNERISGWMDLHEWLRPYQEKGDTVAGLRVFANCGNLIRCLPQLQFDERRPNDVATQPHELTHAPDAIRYFAAGRPFAAGGEKPQIQLPFALRTSEEERKEEYLQW